ncbi:unnamed protein product [Clonostachys byssicola]|uniref:Interferon-related developmental regulator N-terminal domain-containing protein n=1 Tax=Clonostachys byssicola TaxID=160290 RepID=A0A9N9UX16_9HYPO|nr:unnamed protein product [Clonostachys byssicola]
MSLARVKALKGEKTVSRKARKSGRASGTASPGGSDILQKVFQHEETSYRSGSEATPPETPPVTYDSDSDGGSQLLALEELDLTPFDPKKLVSELQDRKNNQTDTRELLLHHYVKTLRNQYSAEFDNFDGQVDELFGVFLRGANRGATPKERSLSLQSYFLTATIADVDRVDSTRNILKQILSDDDDEECQIHALYALCLTVVFYAASKDEVFDFLDFLVEIVQSNGDSINALDKDGVMVATFECWAFAATHVDIWQHADYAMDTFVEKLDSTDVETQTIASECIAFIFEASRAHEQEEGEPFQLPYDPQRIAGRINGLTKVSVKSRSRKDRRDLRESLRSVGTSLDRGVGPYYSTATNAEDGKELGYRFKLRKRDAIGHQYHAPVESWHFYHRIHFLRNVFKGGLERHMENDNPIVIDCLDGLDWSAVPRSS